MNLLNKSSIKKGAFKASAMAPKCEQQNKKKKYECWCVHAVQFRQTTNHKSDKHRKAERNMKKKTNKQKNGGRRLQLAKNRNSTKIIQKTTILHCYWGLPLRIPWLRMWKREVQLTCNTLWKKKKKKLQPQTIRERKKILGEKSRRVQSIDKSQCKKYEGKQMSSTKETWLHNTNHIRKKKTFFFS